MNQPYIYKYSLPKDTHDDVTTAWMRRIEKFSHQKNFHCIVSFNRKQDDIVISCGVNNLIDADHLELFLHGEQYKPKGYVYQPADSQLQNPEWVQETNAYLQQYIHRNNYSVHQQPTVRICFDFLSQHIDFAKAADTFGKRTLAPNDPFETATRPSDAMQQLREFNPEGPAN